jgi:hypothetical protein
MSCALPVCVPSASEVIDLEIKSLLIRREAIPAELVEWLIESHFLKVCKLRREFHETLTEKLGELYDEIARLSK